MSRKKFISLVCLIVCVGIVFEFDAIVGFVSKTSYSKYSEVDFNHNSDFENRAKLLALTDAFLVVEKDAVYLYDDLGQPKWSKALSSQNTLVYTGNKRMVLAEQKAGDIFVLDEKGDIVASVLGIGPLSSVKIFGDQYVGAVKTDGTLNIYDEKMNLIGLSNLPNGEMIDYDVNLSRQDVVMGILDLSRTDFNSKLVIAGFNGNIISGSNLIQDLIYDIELTDDEMWIVTDHQLRIYNYDSTLAVTVDLDRLVSGIYFDKTSGIMFLQLTNEASALDNPKSKQTLVGYDKAGTLLFDTALPMDEVNGIRGFGDKLCLFNAHEVYFLNREGERLENYNVLDTIQDVLLTRSNTFGIVYDNSMDVYVSK